MEISFELEMDFSGNRFLLEVIVERGEVIGQRSRQCGAKGCRVIVTEDNHAYHFSKIENGYCDGKDARKKTLWRMARSEAFRRQIELAAEKKFNDWLVFEEDQDEYPDGISVYLQMFLCDDCTEHHRAISETVKEEANQKLRGLGASKKQLFVS